MSSSKFFYCGRHLVHSLHDQGSQRYFRASRRPLAELCNSDSSQNIKLIHTDAADSVIATHLAQTEAAVGYTAYGHAELTTDAHALLGFNAEHQDPHSLLYHLGQGHRAYSTVLMRFSSPDGTSPFSRGGVNAYAYCSGDPVNYADPTGRWLERILKNFGTARLRKKHNLHTQKFEVTRAGESLENRAQEIADDSRRNAVAGLRRLDQIEPDLYDNIVQHLSPNDLQAAFNAPERHRRINMPKTEAWLETKSHQAANAHLDDIMKGTPRNYLEDGNLTNGDLFKLQRVEKNLILTLRPYTQEYARDKYKPFWAEFNLSIGVAGIRRWLNRH